MIGKYSDEEKCEDAIVHTEDYVAIIDGATSIDPNGEKSGGRVAVEALAKQIESLAPDLSLSEAEPSLSGSLRARLDPAGHDEQSKERPSASVVMYSSARREIWRIGAGSYLAGGIADAKVMALEAVLSNTRSVFLQSCLHEGKTVNELLRDDPGRVFILPLLRRQYGFMNRKGAGEYGYGALDGNPVPAAFLETIPIHAACREVILASDGYPAVLPTLAESEAYLEQIRKTDPLCITEFKSTKAFYPGQVSFDDRAYVRIKV